MNLVSESQKSGGVLARSEVQRREYYEDDEGSDPNDNDMITGQLPKNHIDTLEELNDNESPDDLVSSPIIKKEMDNHRTNNSNYDVDLENGHDLVEEGQDHNIELEDNMNQEADLQYRSQTGPSRLDLSDLDKLNVYDIVQLFRCRIKNNHLGQVHYFPTKWNGIIVLFRFQVQTADPNILIVQIRRR